MNKAFVLVGDMVASRHQEDRAELAEAVRRALAQINEHFEHELHAPLVTTRGLDELSAVLEDPTVSFDLLVRLNLALWPVRFRVALAFGDIDVAQESRDAAAMDGPAFHAAAAAIAEMKSDGRLFAVHGDSIDSAASSLASALGSAHQSMTAELKGRTVETLQWLYGRPPHEPRPTQEEIAAAMNLSSRQAVSDALRRADHSTLAMMEDALRTWLGSLKGTST